MRKAIVTGGAGFIGSHLCDALIKEGLQVVALDNLANGREKNLEQLRSHPDFAFHQVDVSSDDLVSHFDGATHVFHLAALADIVPSIENPLSYMKANLDGTVKVLEAARAAQVNRFLYAASSSCYGIPDQYPTREDAECRPEYPYALSKYLGEQAVMHWHRVYGMPALSLRLFNVYGPRARTSGTYGAVFGVFLAQKLAGKPFTIVGDGTQTRDFTFVSDVVDAFVTAAKSDRCGEIYNVGTGNPTSVNRIAELLQGPRVQIPKRPGEPDCTHADVGKIQAQLNWSAKVSIEDGIAQLLQSIGAWSDAPVWTPESISAATETWFRYLGDSPNAKSA